MHSPPELTMDKNAELVINWCENNCYQAWYLKEKIKLINAEQIAHRGRCHLLLLPEHDTFPKYLIPIAQGSKIEVGEL